MKSLLCPCKYYRYPGKLRVVGGSDRQGIYIEASAAKQAADSGEDIGLVVHQNADDFLSNFLIHEKILLHIFVMRSMTSVVL